MDLPPGFPTVNPNGNVNPIADMMKGVIKEAVREVIREELGDLIALAPTLTALADTPFVSRLARNKK